MENEVNFANNVYRGRAMINVCGAMTKHTGEKWNAERENTQESGPKKHRRDEERAMTDKVMCNLIFSYHGKYFRVHNVT